LAVFITVSENKNSKPTAGVSNANDIAYTNLILHILRMLCD